MEIEIKILICTHQDNPKFMKIVPILLSILLIVGMTNGQIPLNFNHITSDDGLTSNLTSCLLKDSRGFLWIGTEAGLNRFDGKNIIPYTKDIEDPGSLVNNDINTLFEDGLHRIWIGTRSGLSILEPESTSFINFRKIISGSDTIDLTTGVLSINQFQNKIWIATHDQIITSPLDHYHFDILVDSLPSRDGKTTYFLPNKTIVTSTAVWFLASTGPICFEDGKTMYNWDNNPGNWSIFKKFRKGWISSLYNDGDSVLYFTTFPYRGVYSYRPVNQQLDSIPFPDEDEVNGIWTLTLTRLNDDELLGSTWKNGIYTLNTNSGVSRFYLPNKNIPRSISSNHCNQTLIDDQGTIFVATDRGLNYLNPSQLQFKLFDISDILLDNMGRSTGKNGLAMAEDDQGNFWFGTQLGGLFSFTPATGMTKQFTFPGRYNRIWSIYYENDKLLLGTDGGLANFSIPSEKLKPLANEIPDFVHQLTSPHTSLPASSTFILKDPSGAHWIAIFPYGLLKYNFQTREYIHYTTNDPVYHLPGLGTISSGTIDNEGILWVGYRSNNISAINTIDNSIRNFKIHLQEDSVTIGNITSLAHDRKGNLWIATTQAGLFKYNIALDSFTSYDTRKGLSSDILGSVVIDDEGNLWASSTKGLNKLEPETGTDTEYISIYNSADGFLSDQFDLSPLFTGKNGTLYTCTGKYLIQFRPEELQNNIFLPSLVFPSYKKSGEEYAIKPTDQQIDFNFRDRTITFDFYGINFIDPAKTRYAYKLEGFDKDWNTTSQASAIYASLPPGNYTLRIKASNKTKEWTPEVTKKIHVEGALWMKWWFISLCVCICLLILFGIYWIRLSQSNKIQSIRNKISRDLHDEIGSTLGSISIFSTAAEMMEEKQFPEIKTTLAQIGIGARSALENMSDIVWAINPTNDTFRNLIERLQIYAYKLLEAKNIHLTLDLPEDLYGAKLTLPQRRNIYLILREAVYNVAKYSKANNCIISAQIENQSINLQIKDDGHGFDEISKNLGGNGIIHMKQRADELNAVFTVFTEKLQGTILTLQFKHI